MVESLPDMPAGTVGLRLVGKVGADDYRDSLIPALRAGVEAGELRALFVVGPDYEGFDMGALREDIKGAVPLAFGHREAWKRVAAVTDVEWVGKGVELFHWAMPGDVRVFPMAELEQAKAWVAGG